MSRVHIPGRTKLCVGVGALVISLGLVSACGQKGPLYLPPRNGTVITRPSPQNPSPQTAAPEDKNNKKSSDDSAQQQPK